MVKVIEDKNEELLFDIPHASFVFVELAHALVKRGEALPTSASGRRPLGKSIFDAGDAGVHLGRHLVEWVRGDGKGKKSRKTAEQNEHLRQYNLHTGQPSQQRQRNMDVLT